jgi:Na+/H+ antiporter NhaC
MKRDHCCGVVGAGFWGAYFGRSIGLGLDALGFASSHGK